MNWHDQLQFVQRCAAKRRHRDHVLSVSFLEQQFATDQTWRNTTLFVIALKSTHLLSVPEHRMRCSALLGSASKRLQRVISLRFNQRYVPYQRDSFELL